MTPHIVELTAKIRELEAELDAELAQRRAELRVGMERGRAFFEEEILRRHRELKTRFLSYILKAHPLVVLTAPVIYALIVPFVLLDLFVTFYQAVCFPVYGIPKVRRGDYLVFDRYHLGYLNVLEKINCAYCSHANGLIAYVREIAGRTEQYWCPIKHAKRVIGAHPRYASLRTMAMRVVYRKWIAQFQNADKDKSRSRRADGPRGVIMFWSLRRLAHVDDVHDHQVRAPIASDGKLHGSADADSFEQVRQIECTSNRRTVGRDDDIT